MMFLDIVVRMVLILCEVVIVMMLIVWFIVVECRCRSIFMLDIFGR